MTTYQYRIVLNDSEMIALESAPRLFLQVTREKLRAKEQIPYPHNLSDAQSILDKLHADVQQISGNSWDGTLLTGGGDSCENEIQILLRHPKDDE
jgi:hypothetical protein